MAQLTAGQLIANDYRLVRELGRGGFGVVWHAYHLRLSREVAIKMIHGEALVRVPDAAARFMREVELAKQLEHPNVVRMYDFGSLPDQSLFMVMEFIKGEELKQILIQRGPLGTQRTTAVICQVLDALSEAHGLGIIHRDLKPANIMLTSKGLKHDVVKLLDFGIAKALAAEGQQDLTGTGAGYGTPHYMAPEVVMGRTIGPYTDIYAIGLMMLECLTGQRAVSGNTPHEIALKQVMEDVFIPAHVAHTGLGPILRRAMAKDPAHRYQSAAEMFRDIQDADSVHVAANTPLGPLSGPNTGDVPDIGQMEYSSRPMDTGAMPTTIDGQFPRYPSFDSLSAHSFPPRSMPHSAIDSAVHPLAGPDASGLRVRPASSGRGTIVLLAALAAFVAVLGAVAFVLLSGSPSDSGSDELATSDHATEQPDDSGAVVNRIPSVQELPDEAAKRLAVVQIESDVEADVLIGDEIIGTTPFEVTNPIGSEAVTYILAAEGRQNVSLSATFAQSRVYFVPLPKATPAAAATSAPQDKGTSTAQRRRNATRRRAKDDGEEQVETKPEKRTFRRIGREENSGDVDVPTL